MRTISLCLVCAASLMPGHALQVMSGSVWNDQVRVRYETRVEPGGGTSMKGIGGGIKILDDIFHRVVFDSSREAYFGYDVAVEPLPGIDAGYEVKIQLLSGSADELNLGDRSHWKRELLPAYPAPQILQTGDQLALELMVNPSTGQRLVDYLTVGPGDARQETSAGEAHDFQIEDAMLTLRKPVVRVDGNLVTAAPGGTVRGAAAWVYIGGHGRYALSLQPHSSLGFTRAGEIRGSTLRFEWVGRRVEVNCDGRIAPGLGVYNLYVHHDPVYRPSLGAGELEFGAAGSAAGLIGYRGF